MKRRYLRLLGLLLLWYALSATLVQVVLKSTLLKAYLQRRIAIELQQSFKERVEFKFKDLTLQVLPPKLALGEVALTVYEEEAKRKIAVNLWLDHLYFKVQPRLFKAKHFLVGEIVLEGLKVDLRGDFWLIIQDILQADNVATLARVLQNLSAKPNTPPLDIQAFFKNVDDLLWSLPLALEGVQIAKSEINNLLQPLEKIVVPNFRVAWQRLNKKQLEVTLALKDVSYHLPSKERPDFNSLALSLQAQGVVVKNFKEHEVYRYLELKRAELNLGENNLALSGRIALTPYEATHLELKTVLLGQEFKKLLACLPELDFKLELKATFKHEGVKAHLSDKLLQGELYLSNISWLKQRYGEFTALFTYGGENLEVESLTFKDLDIGRVDGKVNLSFNKNLEVRTHLNLERLTLQHILGRTGIDNAWVQLSTSGEVQAKGTLAPLNLGLDFNLFVHDFASLDRGHQDKQALSMLQLRNVRIKGKGSVDKEQLALKEVTLQKEQNKLKVEGWFSLDPQGMFMLYPKGIIDLASLGLIADIPFTGYGYLVASVGGAYDAVEIMGKADLTDFSLMHYNLGNVVADIAFKDNALKIDNIEIKQASGRLRGDLALIFPLESAKSSARAKASRERAKTLPPPQEENVLIKSELVLEHIDIAKYLLDTGNLPPSGLTAFLSKVKAEAEGKIILTGLLKNPGIKTEIKIPNFFVTSLRLGEFQLKVDVGMDTSLLTPWLISTKLLLSNNQGKIETLSTLERAELPQLGPAFKTDVKISKVPLLAFGKFFEEVTLGGDLVGELHLGARLPPLAKKAKFNFADFLPDLTALSGEFFAEAVDLVVNEWTLADLQLTGQVNDGRLTSTLKALNSELSANLVLNLTSGYDYRVNAQLQMLDLIKVYKLGPLKEALIVGDAEVRGNLQEKTSLSWQLNLQDMVFNLGNLNLTLEKATTLKGDLQGLQLAEGLRIQDKNFTAELRGNYAFQGEHNTHLVLAGDLQVLMPFIPLIDFARGKLDVNLWLRGNAQDPKFVGNISIADGFMRLWQSTQVVENLTTRAVITGRSMNIVEGAALVNGGKFKLTGEALFPVDDPPELNLRASLKQVKIRSLADVEAMLSGNLNLQGFTDDLLLKGDLILNSLKYTTNLDLEFEKILQKKRTLPLLAPKVARDEGLRLAVKINAPNNVLLVSPYLEAELRADLLLTGTSGSPGLLGNITPLWTKAKYRDQTLEIERAYVDFIDEYRIRPRLQLQARTRACGMKIGINISGEMDDYNVILSGQDERGNVEEQEVLGCLVFGLRLHDYRGQYTSNFNEAAWPGGLDALWTVSGLDQKVKNLLPLDVNEIRVTSAWSNWSKRTTPRLVVGKNLNDRLELKYSRALEDSQDNIFILEYRLSDNAIFKSDLANSKDLSLSGDLGLDLTLRWEFR